MVSGRLPKMSVSVLHALGECRVHPLVLSVVVDEIQHVHVLASLTEALDATEPLLQTRGIPR